MISELHSLQASDASNCSCSNYTSSIYVQSTGFCLIVCVVWVVTVDQVVPLPETQRTEPTPNAAPPPGSDTPIHTAPTTGQLSGCRGAGGCSPVSLHTVYFAMLLFFYHWLFWFTFQFLDILSHIKWPGWLRIFIDRQTANSSSSKRYVVHVQGSIM